ERADAGRADRSDLAPRVLRRLAKCCHSDFSRKGSVPDEVMRHAFFGNAGAAGGRAMKKRVLGQSALEVSAIGFGCMGLNFGYATSVSKGNGIKLIRQAVER